MHAAHAAVLDRAQETEHTESYDSVSTTDRPRTCRQPPSSQPIAVTTAVEQTLPPRRHFTYAAFEPQIRRARFAQIRPSSSATSASRFFAIALTWSFDNLEMPSFSATRCTLRVDVPVAYISATAATTARSTRW